MRELLVDILNHINWVLFIFFTSFIFVLINTIIALRINNILVKPTDILKDPVLPTFIASTLIIFFPITYPILLLVFIYKKIIEVIKYFKSVFSKKTKPIKSSQNFNVHTKSKSKIRKVGYSNK